MPAPSFNGVYMFGIVIEMHPYEFNPVDFQRNSCSGLDGVEQKRLGSRGAYTRVKGVLSADSLTDFNIAVGLWVAARSWGKCTLIDNRGNAWPLVSLDSFEEESRVSTDIITGTLCMDYSARFFHPIT